MRLERLTLQGYKSFANKTEFRFPTGITAIVGPNGSGKSNIADAIRWGLGERSMSTLRAKSTADMIFVGGEGRARAGMAEVSLTFDNADGGLPIEFSEVTITRRAYRSGENEYLINGSRVLLRDINELLAESGLSEQTYTVISQGLVDAALALRPQERRTLFEEAAGISLYRDRREKTVERLHETERNLERVYDIVSEVSPRLERLERDAERVEQERRLTAHLERLQRTWYGYRWGRQQARLDRALERAANVQDSLAARRREASELSTRLGEVRRRQGELRTRLRDWYRQGADLRDRADEVHRELAVSEERERLLRDRRDELLAEAESLEKQAEERAQQMADLEGRIEVLERELAQRRKRLADAEQEARSKKQKAGSRERERARVEQELHVHRAGLDRLDQALLEARAEEGRLKGERAALERIHIAFDVGVNGVLEANLDGVIGLLGTLIRVPSQWERAVEAALGADLRAIVVRRASIAGRVRSAIESLGRRLTLLPLDSLRPPPQLPAGALCAAGIVSCDASARPAVDALLGAVALCEDLGEAQALLPDMPPGSRCATAGGIVLRADGALVVGGEEGSVLADERARREIRQQLKEVRSRCEEMERQRRAESNEIAALEKQLEDIDRRAASAGEQKARNVREKAVEARTRVAVMEESLRGQRAALDRELGLLQRVHSQMDGRRERADQLETERAALLDRLGVLRREASQLEKELREVRSQIGPAEEELERLGDEHTRLEKGLRRAENRLREAEARHGRAELEVERCQDELRLLARRIDQELGLVELELADSVTAQAPLPLRPLVSELPIVESLPEGLQEEMRFIKKRLRQLGAVNPNAPQELAEVQERHRFLTEQGADLEAASARLRQALADLDELMETAFQETFDAVAGDFSETFSHLFDGGAARLELTDPDDLLNTGVEIVARPPGKRAQPLPLLSGGERALTAVALLFALIGVSPTPFCVFDEVDATLDEANVGRFRTRLEGLAQETQFIIITHNRGTIESADTIYGISMGSDAVSQVVSLKMDD